MLLLSCMISLYIFDSNPLSNIWFGNIFSHSVGRLFSPLIVSFAVQKLFSWCSSICWFLLLLLVLFGVTSKKHHYQDQCQEDSFLSFFSPYASFWEFYGVNPYVSVVNPIQNIYWIHYFLNTRLGSVRTKMSKRGRLSSRGLLSGGPDKCSLW